MHLRNHLEEASVSGKNRTVVFDLVGVLVSGDVLRRVTDVGAAEVRRRSDATEAGLLEGKGNSEERKEGQEMQVPEKDERREAESVPCEANQGRACAWPPSPARAGRACPNRGPGILTGGRRGW